MAKLQFYFMFVHNNTSLDKLITFANVFTNKLKNCWNFNVNKLLNKCQQTENNNCTMRVELNVAKAGESFSSYSLNYRTNYFINNESRN